jgi:CheY-like chemotaxis protein
LAVVWGVVKDHNGYIDVWSKEGEGSVFTLYFPVTREPLAEAQKAAPPDEFMGRGESLLVVDDIKEQRELAVSMLTRLGYRVDTVSSGEESLDYLRENRVDLIVLDMIMAPGMDGLETYRRILAMNPDQKAVIVSGFAETARVKQAQQLGAGPYVRKPYLMEKIGMAIQDALRKSVRA